MTQDRPKIHPKWILITLLSRWGWKNASTLLRRQFFSRYLQCFFAHHTSQRLHATWHQKFKNWAPMQEKRVFFTRTHPRKHAQEVIFPVIYSIFLRISNTDFEPQKSANHRAPPSPPPWLPQKKRLSVSNAFRHQASQVPFFQNPIWAMWKTCKISRIWVLKTSTIPKWRWAVYGDTIGFTLWSPSGSKFWNAWN